MRLPWYLRADFQHKFRFNLILPLVCYVEGSLKNGPLFQTWSDIYSGS
jgi:hypothetical protein